MSFIPKRYWWLHAWYVHIITFLFGFLSSCFAMHPLGTQAYRYTYLFPRILHKNLTKVWNGGLDWSMNSLKWKSHERTVRRFGRSILTWMQLWSFYIAYHLFELKYWIKWSVGVSTVHFCSRQKAIQAKLEQCFKTFCILNYIKRCFYSQIVPSHLSLALYPFFFKLKNLV